MLGRGTPKTAGCPGQPPKKNPRFHSWETANALSNKSSPWITSTISLSNWGWVFLGGLDSCSGLRQLAPKKMESTQLEVACVLENMIISLGVIPSQDAIRHDTDVSKQKDPKKTDCCLQEIKHFYNVWRYNSFF